MWIANHDNAAVTAAVLRNKPSYSLASLLHLNPEIHQPEQKTYILYYALSNDWLYITEQNQVFPHKNPLIIILTPTSFISLL